MTNKVIYLTDRTAEEVVELCGMKYYWYRVHGERGIVPVEEEEYFITGRGLHEDLEGFAQGKTTEEVLFSLGALPPGATQIELENFSRRLGWVAAWGVYVEPLLRNDFAEVSYESEYILDRSPLWVAIRPDRIQRRKGGGLVYREWKSTSTIKREWVDHWTYAIQVHLGLAAIKEELGEEIEYGQVTGFYKGFNRDGRLVHPYVWAYFKGGEWSHEYKYGWEHRPVWEYENGMLDWVRRCGKEVADKQFIWSAPVFLDERKVEEWVAVRKFRHHEIELAKNWAKINPVTRRRIFKPASIHCRPAYGPACPYLAACHNYTVNSDPVGSGLYKPRTPHHEIELVGVE